MSLQTERTPQNRATRSSIRRSLGFAGAVFGGALIVIWLSIYIGFLVTTPGWPLIVAVWGLVIAGGSVAIAIAEKRKEHRAQAYAAAFAKIEEAAKSVSHADSGSDRARNMVKLRQAIIDAGRIGASSPISTLPDDPVATIESSIGAIQAEAEYERGQLEERQRRTNVLAYVFGVFGILGFVVGLISLLIVLVGT